ncbi:SMP-30/gluconolactonase/LRE family protein [Myxococcus sp. CA056]|uniref:SMP-30/gluconolactonase/LRE family protein n=1 Tax=Myxococcus sp. CA056 TaxID=2741740 RepID=UPI00157AC9AD|nr:SMP-30/gluconolactonase/LRE family protein [Myxococcus sp. CA056]NTX10888.1 SMP-30/gluconolactonase/LRE family protein [Myxococcus sp. CA056]
MKKLLIIAGVLFVAVGGLILKTFSDAGQFKSLSPHAPGKCKPVSGMPGAEDITFHPGLGYAYVSSDDRRATMAGSPVTGGIYRYELSGTAPPVLLTGGFSPDFHPHGISLHVDPSGAQTLFVVNHTQAEDNRIERFEVGEDGLLVHRATFRDALLVSPNDVVAMDAQRFYVTNDHGNPPGMKQRVEDYLQLAQGNVLYFDGQRFQEVIQGTKYANGINRSLDGSTVYVAQSVGRSLSSYARDPKTGALTLLKTLDLDSGPDNIELDAEGNLWIASHPKLLDFASHAGDPTGKTRSPAQVLRLTGKGADLKASEVFLDDGSQTSGTATAAVFGKRMLLGPVFEKDFLDCELP